VSGICRRHIRVAYGTDLRLRPANDADSTPPAIPLSLTEVSERSMPFQRRKPTGIGIKAPVPDFVRPVLATAVDKVPGSDRWLHEIKFDGYRVQLNISVGAIRVFTRNGYDWTRRLKKIAYDAWHINAGSAIIDGEVVVPSADGTTDFSVLQNELKGKSEKIVMVAFDLLYLNGYDLRKLPPISASRCCRN
jgi:bifunctional non-homologous end joining protein LigD